MNWRRDGLTRRVVFGISGWLEIWSCCMGDTLGGMMRRHLKSSLYPTNTTTLKDRVRFTSSRNHSSGIEKLVSIDLILSFIHQHQGFYINLLPGEQKGREERVRNSATIKV